MSLPRMTGFAPALGLMFFLTSPVASHAQGAAAVDPCQVKLLWEQHNTLRTVFLLEHLPWPERPAKTLAELEADKKRAEREYGEVLGQSHQIIVVMNDAVLRQQTADAEIRKAAEGIEQLNQTVAALRKDPRMIEEAAAEDSEQKVRDELVRTGLATEDQSAEAFLDQAVQNAAGQPGLTGSHPFHLHLRELGLLQDAMQKARQSGLVTVPLDPAIAVDVFNFANPPDKSRFTLEFAETVLQRARADKLAILEANQSRHKAAVQRMYAKKREAGAVKDQIDNAERRIENEKLAKDKAQIDQERAIKDLRQAKAEERRLRLAEDTRRGEVEATEDLIRIQRLYQQLDAFERTQAQLTRDYDAELAKLAQLKASAQSAAGGAVPDDAAARRQAVLTWRNLIDQLRRYLCFNDPQIAPLIGQLEALIAKAGAAGAAPGVMPISVPWVVGKSLEEAINEIVGAGLKVALTKPARPDTPDRMTVTMQDPAAGFLGPGGIVSITAENKRETVPDVVNKPLATAVAEVTAARLTAQPAQGAAKLASPVVKRQTPAAGSFADRGSAVTLDVEDASPTAPVASSGGAPAAMPISVPWVVGKSLLEAINAIAGAGLKAAPDLPAKPDTPDRMTVTMQDPATGFLGPGGQVRIKAENTRETVPDVVNKTLAAAVAEVTAARLTAQPTPGAAKFASPVVKRQTPAAGSFADRGSAVTLDVEDTSPTAAVDPAVVESGMVVVPHTPGLTVKAGKSLLAARGLRAAVQIQGDPPPSADESTVVAQEPSSGALVAPGTVVSMVIDTDAARPKTTVPSVSGLKVTDAYAQLDARGLVADTLFLSEAPPTPGQAGTVKRQTPAPDTAAQAGDVVQVYVYGQVVPCLLNWHQDKFDLVLDPVGMRVGSVEVVKDAPREDLEGCVYWQSPAPGSPVPKDKLMSVKLYGKWDSTSLTAGAGAKSPTAGGISGSATVTGANTGGAVVDANGITIGGGGAPASGVSSGGTRKPSGNQRPGDEFLGNWRAENTEWSCPTNQALVPGPFDVEVLRSQSGDKNWDGLTGIGLFGRNGYEDRYGTSTTDVPYSVAPADLYFGAKDFATYVGKQVATFQPNHFKSDLYFSEILAENAAGTEFTNRSVTKYHRVGKTSKQSRTGVGDANRHELPREWMMAMNVYSRQIREVEVSGDEMTVTEESHGYCYPASEVELPFDQRAVGHYSARDGAFIDIDSGGLIRGKFLHKHEAQQDAEHSYENEWISFSGKAHTKGVSDSRKRTYLEWEAELPSKGHDELKEQSGSDIVMKLVDDGRSTVNVQEGTIGSQPKQIIIKNGQATVLYEMKTLWSSYWSVRLSKNTNDADTHFSFQHRLGIHP